MGDRWGASVTVGDGTHSLKAPLRPIQYLVHIEAVSPKPVHGHLGHGSPPGAGCCACKQRGVGASAPTKWITLETSSVEAGRAGPVSGVITGVPHRSRSTSVGGLDQRRPRSLPSSPFAWAWRRGSEAARRACPAARRPWGLFANYLIRSIMRGMWIPPAVSVAALASLVYPLRNDSALGGRPAVTPAEFSAPPAMSVPCGGVAVLWAEAGTLVSLRIVGGQFLT